MNHRYFWPRWKGINSTSPQLKVTLIHDSYFLTLIQPLNFIATGGYEQQQNHALCARGYAGVCARAARRRRRRVAESPTAASLVTLVPVPQWASYSTAGTTTRKSSFGFPLWSVFVRLRSWVSESVSNLLLCCEAARPHHVIAPCELVTGKSCDLWTCYVTWISVSLMCWCVQRENILGI